MPRIEQRGLGWYLRGIRIEEGDVLLIDGGLLGQATGRLVAVVARIGADGLRIRHAGFEVPAELGRAIFEWPYMVDLPES